MARGAMVIVKAVCGCKWLGTLEEAKAHAQEKDHTLTVLGTVVPLEPAPKVRRRDWRHKDDEDKRE